MKEGRKECRKQRKEGRKEGRKKDIMVGWKERVDEIEGERNRNMS